MSLNPTKEQYEAKRKRKDIMTMKVVIGIGIICACTFGLLVKSPYLNVGVSMIVYGVIGSFFTLLLLAALEANRPPETPFCVYEYFEEKEEKVLSSINLGMQKHTGKYSYYDASNYFEVETTKAVYVIKVENDEIVSVKHD